MEISEKDEFSAEKRNTNYDNQPADWGISENLISASCSPSQTMNSFGQTLWYDPTNVQAVGYGGFNASTSSSSSSFRGTSLEMAWNLLPPKGNGFFLPNASSFLPPSMAQYPADSGFIERAARFSLFSDMVNQPPLQGHCPSNEVNVGVAHNDAMKDPNVPGSVNVSEDTQSSGGNDQKVGETSSKGFDSKKRKRNRQNSEADQPHRSEEEPDNNGDNKKRNVQIRLANKRLIQRMDIFMCGHVEARLQIATVLQKE